MRILSISDYSGFNRIKPEPEVFIGLAKRGFDIHVMTFEKAHFYKKRFEAVVVPMKEPQAMADAILKFYNNPDLKKRLAENANCNSIHSGESHR